MNRFSLFRQGIILLTFITLTVGISAQDKIMPRFNYSIFNTLESKGSFNRYGQRDGQWTVYFVDSTEWAESIAMRDEGWNLYPPHRIMLVKATGKFLNGRRQGEWTYYKTYGSRKPLKWDLMQTLTFDNDQVTGPWKYFFTDGKVMLESNYDAEGQTHGKLILYFHDHSIRESWNYNHGMPDGEVVINHYTGQPKWRGTFSDGLYNGEVQEYYTSGQLKQATIYKDGNPWTAVSAFHRNGSALERGTLKDGAGTLYVYNEWCGLTGITEYKNGNKNGWYKEYARDGMLYREMEYVDDTANGTWKEYYLDGGTLRSELHVIDGLFDGVEHLYYKNGKLFTERSYKEGVLWNVGKIYDPDGKTLEIGTFKDGNGYLNVYDDSSRRVSKDFYEKGLFGGMCTDYFKNGKIECTTEYKEGLEHGKQKWYNENGQLVLTCNYEYGQLHGRVTSYYDNGNIEEDDFYYRGRLWEVISMSDSTGKSFKFGKFSQGTGVLKTCDETGALMSTTTYSCGLEHGKQTGYYPSGKKWLVCQYNMGMKEGVQMEYYENGKKMMQSTFHDSREIGTRITWHSNGIVWQEKEVVEGAAWTVFYNNDMNGKPQDKGTLKDGTGTLTRYDEKGNLLFTYEFKNGWCMNEDQDTVSNKLPH